MDRKETIRHFIKHQIKKQSFLNGKEVSPENIDLILKAFSY